MGALVLGNYPWLEGLLPLHWTRWVPDHVVFWKAAPYVIYAAAVLLVGGPLFAQVEFAAGQMQIDAFNVTRELVAIAAIAATLVFGFVVARAARPILSDIARILKERLLFVYWTISIVAVSVGFVITTAPQGTFGVRYLTPLWPALLTLIVIVYRRRAITGLAALAAGCAIPGCFGLGRGLYTPGPAVHARPEA